MTQRSIDSLFHQRKSPWFVNLFIGRWRSCTVVKARGGTGRLLIMDRCVWEGRGKSIGTLLLWYFNQDSGLTLLKTHCGDCRANGGAARSHHNRCISTRRPPPSQARGEVARGRADFNAVSRWMGLCAHLMDELHH